MKIVLHIGIHKTGSTAIQHFFARNRRAYAEQGILYPSKFVKYDAHHPLAWAVGVRHPDRDESIRAEDILQAIKQEAAEVRADTVVLSSEEFRNMEAGHAQKLKQLFADMPVQVVVYLRRQDDFLLSKYGQHLRMYSLRYAGTIHDFYFRHNFINRYNYMQLIERWAGVFGREAITARVYDRKHFPNGNIIADFSQAIGVTAPTGGLEEANTVNRNLSPLALEILRRANTRPLDEATHKRLVKLLDQMFRGDSDTFALMSQRNRLDLLAQFSHSNALVARQWVGREDGNLFGVDLDQADNLPPHREGASQDTIAAALLDCLIEALRNEP